MLTLPLVFAVHVSLRPFPTDDGRGFFECESRLEEPSFRLADAFDDMKRISVLSAPGFGAEISFSAAFPPSSPNCTLFFSLSQEGANLSSLHWTLSNLLPLHRQKF